MSEANDQNRVPDPFDGGCPADTITAQIVEAPANDQSVYAVLTVWPLTKEADVYSWGGGSMHANALRVEKWNGDDNTGRAYLIRIPIPAK